MSVFTTLAREGYNDHAFDGFDADADGLVLANARAMAWAAPACLRDGDARQDA